MKMCSDCKYAKLDDSTGKLLIFCTRPKIREADIDGWTRTPARIFSPYKKLSAEACLLFEK